MTRDVVATSHPDRLARADALIGAAFVGAERAAGAGLLVARVLSPGVRLVLDPPLVPARVRPRRAVAALARRGRAERLLARGALQDAVTRLGPLLVERTLRLVPLTSLIQDHVDLDALVAGVDLDAVVAGVDIDAVVARVDLDAVVAGVDIDAVARRLDLDSLVSRMDLTKVVTEQVDLDAVVTNLDVDAVIARIDLVALAREVIVAIDLPEIIRESSGSLVYDSVRGVRMQSIDADRQVERLAHRLLRRHGAQDPDTPPEGSR
jgi:hypothetical protein